MKYGEVKNVWSSKLEVEPWMRSVAEEIAKLSDHSVVEYIARLIATYAQEAKSE